MVFPGNIFAVQGQGTYMLPLEQKIHEKNFHTLLKSPKNCKSLAQQNFPQLRYVTVCEETWLSYARNEIHFS